MSVEDDGENVDPVPRIQVAIVGAGATGVELSAELRNTAQVFSAYGLHKLDPKHDIGIVLIEAGPRILPALQVRVSNATADLLTKLGVKLLTGETVAQVNARFDPHGERQDHSRRSVTVWAAGIKAPAILGKLDGLPTNRLGQLVVRRTLQTEIDDNVFALGDCAACPWPGNERNVLPRAGRASAGEFSVQILRAHAAGQAAPRIHVSRFRLARIARSLQRGRQSDGRIDRRKHADRRSARFMYMSLYRLHVAALHGYARMALDTVAHWLRRSTVPRVKLH